MRETFYQQKAEEIFEQLNSGREGLSSGEAGQRLEKEGPNKIESKKESFVWKSIANQIKDPLIYILLIAGIVTAAVGHFVDTGVILAVVFINGVIGFVQEFKAEKAMEAIRGLAAPRAEVTRDGEARQINAEEIVTGDVVSLSAGDKVPADVRLFDVKNLQVDESMLTGESSPVLKRSDPVSDDDLPVGDQANMVFMGTAVTRGKGKGLVVRTGRQSQLGQISEEMKSTEKEKTPLQQNLFKFTKLIAVFSLALSAIVFLIGFFKGYSLLEMTLFSISMAVSVIPEGLPIVITITMAIGLKRMAERNAIVRQLIAVETLGSCDIICSDKTGTITENRMTVRKVFADGEGFWEVQGKGYEPRGAVKKNGEDVSGGNGHERLRDVFLCGLLCNAARLIKKEEEWAIEGDPTEGALVVSAGKYGLEKDKLREDYPVREEIPFDSETQYMATEHEHEGKRVIFAKGSPEKILKLCGREDDPKLNEKARQMAREGLRVLGFASKEGRLNKDEDPSGLEFLGFQGIIDPPRESAVQAIKETKQSGIETVMITGDHKETAAAIARDIGIYDEGDMAVTGQELDRKGRNFLRDNVEKISVYARVSPAHKLTIVETLLKKGRIVAVTGDGVNDAPALKKGTIGVAMGEKGTDVAREASDMVLKDDNFATIVEAVKVGRVIFDNIQKVVFFLLSSSAGVALFIVSALLLDLKLPFYATQILWVNLVTNGLQDIALAYEPGEEGIIRRKPRDPGARILDAFLMKRLVLVGITIGAGALFLFWLKLHQGADLVYARSTALNTVVFFQFFHVLNCRSFDRSVFQMPPFSNPFLFGSLLLATIAQICVLTLPSLQYVFKTTSLDAVTWAQTVGLAAIIILVVEVDKKLRKRFK